LELEPVLVSAATCRRFFKTREFESPLQSADMSAHSKVPTD
jgi:hypothetical protein